MAGLLYRRQGLTQPAGIFLICMKDKNQGWDYRKFARRAHFILLLSVLPGKGSGATVSWTNLSGGNWSAPANWDLHVVPGPADNVLVTSNGTYIVTLDVAASISSLALGGGSGTQTLTNPGSALTIAGGGAINVNGAFGLGGGKLSGNNQVNGTINWGGGIIAGPLTVASGGLLNIAGGGVSLYAPLTNAGTINWSNSSTLTVYNSSPTYSGAIYNLLGASSTSRPTKLCPG